MNDTNDNEVDVDMDGTSDNIDVAPSIQADENASEKIELSDMPIEMLEEILIHLDDKDMLKASHVCKLFASVAEMAFTQNYSKKWYRIECNWRSINPTKPFDKVMLNKYGGKIQKLEIVDGNDELLELVEQKCDNVRSLKLRDVSRIIMLKDLNEAYFGAIYNLELETFAKFIDINPQLEALQFRSNDYALLNLLDGRLNGLKTLEFTCFVSIDRLLPTIRLRSLETLQLGLDDTTDFVRLLQSLNCNHIEKLVLNLSNPGGDDDDVINEICQFETLVSLGLPFYRITLDEVSQLATRLPRLTEFVVGIADGGPKPAENMLSIISMLSQLSKLEIKMDDRNFDRLSNELQSSANDFHARYAEIDTEIKLTNSSKMIAITTDYLFMVQGNSVELHWMANLDEKNVRKVLNSRCSTTDLTHGNLSVELKFVNQCADRTFDIVALAYVKCKWQTGFVDINCLDLKSNGPISVKPNVSSYRTLFPHLRELKIHLEQHSANDFLRHLDEKFCEQIDELWLNAKSDADDPDMTDIFAKFKNLRSLYLGPSSVNINEKYLFSVCKKLKEIKHI